MVSVHKRRFHPEEMLGNRLICRKHEILNKPRRNVSVIRNNVLHAPVFADEFAVSGNVPVWRSSKGNVLGRSHEPIYPTIPDAAADDPELYDRIAVLDMLRGGRLRERRFAEQKIREYLA